MNNVIIIEAYFQGETVEDRIEETIALCKASEANVVATLTQAIKTVTPSTYIGKGKVLEVKALVEETGADIVLFDGELSPSQPNNISDIVNLEEDNQSHTYPY